MFTKIPTIRKPYPKDRVTVIPTKRLKSPSRRVDGRLASQPLTELPGIKGEGSALSSKFGTAGGIVEQPNTLRSLTYVGVVDLVGEGPIKGLHNGLQSVYFNGTQYQNASGQFNFNNTTVEIVLGYPDQGPLPGWTDVESTNAVGLEIFYEQPLVQAINDLNANAVRITLEVSSLYQIDQNSGAIDDYSVAYSIDIQQVDGPWITYPNTLSGKCTSSYYWDTVIDLPGPGPWNFRVSRLQPDDSDTLHNSVLGCASFTTIESQQFTCPDSALIGVLTEVAIFSGSVPTRTYELDNLLISVPSNYDPETRTYTGVWDGTFQTAFSNNPAWVFWEVCTNTRFGLGNYIAPFLPDKWLLYTIAQRCDELIPDGFGGMMPRFTWNGPIAANPTTREQAMKVLQDIASLFWGFVYWYAGTIGVACDMPLDPVGPIFTPSNVIDGRFTYSGTAKKARHQQALITWRDPSQLYQAQVEVVQNLTINAWNAIQKTLLGCTSRGQAHYYGKWLLDVEQNRTQTVVFQAGWDSVGLVPGNVIPIAEPTWAGIRAGGRLKGVTAVGSPPIVTQVQLDAEYNFLSGKSYSLQVVMPDGTTQMGTITNTPGTTDIVTLTNTWTQVPIVGAVCTVVGDVFPKPWYILGMKEVAPNIQEITAFEYDPTQYARIEQNINLQPPLYTIAQNGPPAPPTNLTIKESIYIQNGVTFSDAVASWTPPIGSSVLYYNVQVLGPTGTWQLWGEAPANSATIENLTPGVYSFKVQSVNALGQASTWLELDSVLIQGLLAPPPDVASLQIAVTGEQLTLTWPSDTAPNLGWYRLKWSPQTSAVNWSSAQLVQDNIMGTTVTVPTLGGTFLLKAVSLQGVESQDPVSAVSTVTSANLANAVATLTESPTFSGITTNCTVAGGDLELTYSTLTGYAPSGVYAFANSYDLGAVYTARITSLLNAFGQQFGTTMNYWTILSALPELSGVDASLWSAQINYRITNNPWYDAWLLSGNVTLFADFTTEGTAGPNYCIGTTTYSSGAAWLTGRSGTFTNTTGKYVKNASGVWTLLAANTLPFNHTTVGKAQGLRLEGATNNLFPSPTTFSSTIWLGLSKTANAATGPDGNGDMTHFVTSTSLANQMTETSITGIPANTVMDYSVVVKQDGTYRYFNIGFDASGYWGSLNANVVFDLQEGIIATQGAGIITANIEPEANGCWRCQATSNSGSTGTLALPYMGASPTNLGAGYPQFAGDGVHGFYAWAPQFEALPFASSYYPGNRAADALTNPYSPSSQFTKFLKFTTPPVVTTGTYYVWSLDDGTANNEIVIYVYGGNLCWAVVSGSTPQFNTAIGAVSPDNTYVLAFAAKANSFRASLDGGAIVSQASVAMPISPTTERLGTGAGGAAPLFGDILQNATWDNIFATDQELQTLASGLPAVDIWTDWAPLVVTYATFRGIQFQLQLGSTDPTITPVVSTLSVTIDMDNEVQNASNVSCPSGGLTVNFNPVFYALTSLNVTPMGASATLTPKITSKSNAGFTVQFLNASASPVSATFDWTAQGYGELS